jgi:hypothetical protein
MTRVGLDGQLAARIEAARRQVDRANDGPLAIGQQRLAVQLQLLQPVHLGADVVHDAQPADAFDQLVRLQVVRRAHHDVHLDAALHRAHQPFDDDRVLVALVLQPQRVACGVDELGAAFAAVVRAPDQRRLRIRLELLVMPVGVEALQHLLDFQRIGGGDRVVACLRQVDVRSRVSQFSDSTKPSASSMTIDF